MCQRKARVFFPDEPRLKAGIDSSLPSLLEVHPIQAHLRYRQVRIKPCGLPARWTSLQDLSALNRWMLKRWPLLAMLSFLCFALYSSRLLISTFVMDMMRSKIAFSGRRLVAAQITSSGVPSAVWILVLFIGCCEYLGGQWRHSFMMFVENFLRSWCRLPSVMPAAESWLLIKFSRAGVAGGATQWNPTSVFS